MLIVSSHCVVLFGAADVAVSLQTVIHCVVLFVAAVVAVSLHTVIFQITCIPVLLAKYYLQLKRHRCNSFEFT